jgi:hypothetical protein
MSSLARECFFVCLSIDSEDIGAQMLVRRFLSDPKELSIIYW